MSLLEVYVELPDFEEATGFSYGEFRTMPGVKGTKEPYRNIAVITQQHVAKLPRSWHLISDHRSIDEKDLEDLEKEHNIQQAAYVAGIKVPQPYGLFTIPLVGKGKKLSEELNLNGIKIPALVMQYVKGIKLSVLEKAGFLTREIGDLWLQELEKAQRLGFIPYDAERRNAIFDPEQKQVYLIDLEEWKRK